MLGNIIVDIFLELFKVNCIIFFILLLDNQECMIDLILIYFFFYLERKRVKRVLRKLMMLF